MPASNKRPGRRLKNSIIFTVYKYIRTVYNSLHLQKRYLHEKRNRKNYANKPQTNPKYEGTKGTEVAKISTNQAKQLKYVKGARH